MFQKSNLVVAAFVVGLSTVGSAGQVELTVTNGSAMPLSPGAVYIINGQEAVDQFGAAPSQGLVTLCQTGDPSVKSAELSANANVQSVVTTAAQIQPGQSASIDINVPWGNSKSLHFVAMYGVSKDLCSVINVDSSTLAHVAYDATFEKVGSDSIIEAGASSQPSVPSDPNACQSASNSISCVRTLAQPLASGAQIHAFGGYLPSLLTFLEGRYGAADVQTLLLPSSGAVTYKLMKK